MQILNLEMRNFRSFKSLNLEFSKTKNIIIGNNGLGKTNIVEAIYYLALTKSFRTYDDSVLINTESDTTSIIGIISNRYKNTYKIILNQQGKKAFIDNNQVNKISDYISKINVILFNQEDLRMIKDSPSIRRKLLNMEISQLDNTYLKLLSNYNKVLKQRNSYLKSMLINSMIPTNFLNILTEKLIDYGIQIFNIRKDYINLINENININFKKITKKEGLFIKYISDYNEETKETLVKKYQKDFSRDLNYGKTHYGIHLDDFIFYYNEYLAKDFLSEGEQKNAIISFKLSEVSVFYKKTNTMPILILDDLFSELDKEKIKRIIRFFKKNIQIFITTTDLDYLDQKTLSNSKIFKLTTKKIEVENYE